MKKTLAFFTACLAVICALAANTVLAADTVIKLGNGTLTLQKVDTKPRFAPGDMNMETEKAMAIAFKKSANDKALDDFYDKVVLKDKAGKTYKPGTAIENNDIYTVAFAIPKGLEAGELSLQFKGKTFKLPIN